MCLNRLNRGRPYIYKCSRNDPVLPVTIKIMTARLAGSQLARVQGRREQPKVVGMVESLVTCRGWN